MDAPVVAQPVAVVPPPAELVVEAVLVVRPLRRRAEPQVVIDARRRFAVSRVADFLRLAAVGDPRVAERDIAELAVLDIFDGVLEMLAAPLLRADLHHALVSPN